MTDVQVICASVQSYVQGNNTRQHTTNSNSSSRWREAAWLSVPTLFDLVATTLMNVGLLYVTASGGLPTSRDGATLQHGPLAAQHQAGNPQTQTQAHATMQTRLVLLAVPIGRGQLACTGSCFGGIPKRFRGTLAVHVTQPAEMCA